MKPTILLLVEDDALIAEVLCLELTEAGFELLVTRSGAKAIAELDADASRFKAVVTDINLGDGPSGWDVGRHARELVSGIPVVYTSGDSAHDWSSRGVPDSVMITKPFASAQLVVAISTLITEADTHRKI
jgi:DNA-binding response OmpR family regulator